MVNHTALGKICSSLVRNFTIFSIDRYALTCWKFVAHIYNLAKYWKSNPLYCCTVWVTLYAAPVCRCKHISFIGIEYFLTETTAAWICWDSWWYKKKKKTAWVLLNKRQPNLQSDLFFFSSNGDKCTPLIYINYELKAKSLFPMY